MAGIKIKKKKISSVYVLFQTMVFPSPITGDNITISEVDNDCIIWRLYTGKSDIPIHAHLRSHVLYPFC